ncbi:hypothetical protein FRB99_003673, partial [Tulasnella sp. 403]
TVTTKPFNKTGITKDVFILECNGKKYAAKQVKMPSAAGEDTVNQLHYNFLEGELIRAVQLRVLLGEFQDFAKTRSLQTLLYPFVAPPAWIAKEEPEDPNATVAGNSQTIKRHYLCEPLLVIEDQPVKFSGSLQAGRNKDLKGATADALAHFSVLATKGRLVLTDLQAMQQVPCKMVGPLPVFVLFDPMTHLDAKTTAKLIGDVGPKGIEQFLGQHSCNNICRELGFEQLHLDPKMEVPGAPSSIIGEDASMED